MAASPSARARPFAAPLREDVDAVFSRGEALEASDPARRRGRLPQGAGRSTRITPTPTSTSARCCAKAGAATRRSTLYDEALRRHPEEALLHFNRAIALEDQGRLDEALGGYHASLRLAPDLADAHYNAARLHEQLGDAKPGGAPLQRLSAPAAAALTPATLPGAGRRGAAGLAVPRHRNDASRLAVP